MKKLFYTVAFSAVLFVSCKNEEQKQASSENVVAENELFSLRETSNTDNLNIDFTLLFRYESQEDIENGLKKAFKLIEESAQYEVKHYDNADGEVVRFSLSDGEARINEAYFFDAKTKKVLQKLTNVGKEYKVEKPVDVYIENIENETNVWTVVNTDDFKSLTVYTKFEVSASADGIYQVKAN